MDRALDGPESHRKEGILVERSKYPCLRDPSPPILESWGFLISPLEKQRCPLSKHGYQVVSFLSSTSRHFLDFSKNEDVARRHQS